MMTEIEETTQRIRELQNDIADEYGTYGELVWEETYTYFIDEVHVYSESAVSLVQPDGYEVASGGGIQDGDDELAGILAELGAIEVLAWELDEFNTNLCNVCKKVEEGKRLSDGSTR